MKAVCWYGKHNIRVENVVDPQIINDQDAIIQVTSIRGVIGNTISMLL